ncbi:RNA polymerase sigma factor SigF [Nocardioides caldifontis]|uniref:RNA polymerase sigma factor SigF n=1 Tax=Nocardioides caldifontis TaxID=2588938 RepID=UPI001EF082BC|nr:RNA polymerase sigma factor SigF [Nocardioides caldifontis]
MSPADDTRAGTPDAGAEPETEIVEQAEPDLHSRTAALFAAMQGADSESEAARVRSELVELHLPLAEYLARRFGNRGEPHEDLVQVATIGLIKAIDRFDLERGVAFSTYATPTIVGEIKRHFRDRGWTIRVPRRLQEIQAVINQAVSDLGQELGRSPTVAELAQRAGMSEEEILEGLESANAYSPLSLDAPDPSGEVGAVIEQLGDYDDALDAVVDRETVKPLLDKLDARAKRILLLRFFRNMTQSQIAEELGISQMHVSRLLSRTLSDLRKALEEQPTGVDA